MGGSEVESPPRGEGGGSGEAQADGALSARQAAALLGIQVPSLYAYVSRGLIRSSPGPGPRQRRYSLQDVEALKRRRDERRRPEQALESALHFGGPVLQSSLTLIDDGHLYFRGRNVLQLLDFWSFEEAAAELWLDGGHGRAAQLFAGPDTLPEAVNELRRRLGDLPMVVQLQAVLPSLAHHDAAAFDTRPQGVARTGGRICRALAMIVAAGEPWRGGVVETVQRAWGCPGEAAHHLLRCSLMLCLDHELNVSSFTARTTASAGSTPYAAVLAGLAALQGPKHGGHTRRVEALLREAGGAAKIESVMAERLRRGESLPGLGHTLYPGGDPRCRELLRRTQQLFPEAAATVEAETMAAAGWALLREHPTIDLALVTVARVLELPDDAAITLFALGRTVGWIAHAGEQYAQQQLIRPRARYVGVPPPRRLV